VEGCFPLAQFTRLRPVTPKKIERLIGSGAGSYIGAYIVGIRDRHADNIMIRSDGLMFHIDFGHALGNTVLLDAPAFAVTKQFKDELGNAGYGEFIERCVEAFRVLREPENVALLCDYVPMVFSAIYPEQKVRDYLAKSLMLNLDTDEACKSLHKMITNAPNSYRTFFKNKVHRIAQASKTGSGLGKI